MPLIDMAEAVSRGEIIVDEVDALNAVNSGKLSELETARFSPLVAEHSRRHSTANGYSQAEPLLDADGNELGDANSASGNDYGGHTWDNVLVDEVDIAHAIERGRISRNDLHIVGRFSSGDLSTAQHLLGNITGELSSQEESGWSGVLVDEVDILHAAEQGVRTADRNESVLNRTQRVENEIARPEQNHCVSNEREELSETHIKIDRTSDKRSNESEQ